MATPPTDILREEYPGSAIENAAELLQKAGHTVVLTGAGSSTPSGIPDFRSAGSGLWTRYLPHEVASLSAFRRHPERFFEWLRPLASNLLQAEPNPAHRAITDMEKGGYIQTIITQNIDGLHQRAGAQNVIEVHGTLDTLTCVGCYQQQLAADFIDPYIDEGVIPRCPACDQILKPDAVLFEEQLPADAWVAARKSCQQCDLMIVVGSSLVVMPVAGLPQRALDNGADIIVVNKSETYIDANASVVLQEDVAEILPAIVEKLP